MNKSLYENSFKAKPTLNLNKTCNIPFNYSNILNNFCTSENSVFKCEINFNGSEKLDDCARGNIFKV